MIHLNDEKLGYDSLTDIEEPKKYRNNLKLYRKYID